MAGLASLAALLAATELGLVAVSPLRPPVTLDVGPSTGGYLEGFSESREYGPVSARFTDGRARVLLPLDARGDDVTVTLRYARLAEPAVRARLRLRGGQERPFLARPAPLTLDAWSRRTPRGSPFGDFEVFAAAGLVLDGPARLELIEERGPFGTLAVDWIRFENASWSIPMADYEPRLLVIAFYLVALVAGFGRRGAALAAGAVAAAVVTAAALDPLALVHASARLAWPALLLGLGGAVALRRCPRGRWVALLLVAGYVLKGAALFHPSFFTPDVGSHRRYVLAFRQARGDLAERGLSAQVRAGVGYPLMVAGRPFAFPYSPLYYLPFTLLPDDPATIDEAMKHAGLAAIALEPLAAFLLFALVFGPTRGAVAAAVLAVALPPTFSRLVLAMWPALAGHALEVATIAAATWLALRPDDARRWALTAALAAAALLTYVVTLIQLAAFAAAFAIAQPRLRRRAAAGFGALAVACVLLLYAHALPPLLGEVLPAWRAAGETRAPLLRALADSVLRVGIHYGALYPALSLAGLALARRRAASESWRALAAYGLAFAGLVVLRAAAPDLLRAQKEILFAAPLVAVTSAASLEEIARRGRAGRVAAAVLLATLLGYGLARDAADLAPKIALLGS